MYIIWHQIDLMSVIERSIELVVPIEFGVHMMRCVCARVCEINDSIPNHWMIPYMECSLTMSF